MREQWIIKNLYNRPITVALDLTPAVPVGKQFDLLLFSTKEQICQSSSVLETLQSGRASITKIIDGQIIGVYDSSNYDNLCSCYSSISNVIANKFLVVLDTVEDYTFPESNIVLLCDSKNNDIYISLPPVSSGEQVIIKKISAYNNVIIMGSIEGNGNLILSSFGTSVWLVCQDNQQWWVI